MSSWGCLGKLQHGKSYKRRNLERYMASVKVYCDNRKKRIGDTYEDLHRLMDDGNRYLGKDDRFERY